MGALSLGLHENIPHGVYLSDPCERPSLSSSIAGLLVTRSPMHAWCAHPRFGAARPGDDTAATGNGSLMHALLLGTGPEIVSVDAKDWRTNAAKAARAEAVSAGKLAVLSERFDEAHEKAGILRSRLSDHGIGLDGQKEITAVWEEDGVLCRGRFDHLKAAVIDDIKTTQSAHPEALARHIVSFGYHIQHAAYVSALEKIYPTLAGRVSMRFVFVETEPPYAVTVAEPAGTMRELGDRQWKRAVREWGVCLKTNRWPAYGDGVVRVEAPEWALAQDVGRQMAEMGNDNASAGF